MEDIFSDTIKKLLVDHEKEKENHGNNKKLPCSIHVVPSVFRELSPDSFNPRVVSIGPLHREDKNLKGFQDSKVKYVHHLLDRLADSPIDQTLKTCLFKVNASIVHVRNCYAQKETTKYNDVELAEMMVVDGCFILELILRSLKFGDSIHQSNSLLTQYLICDLLLLENQIPFFVLQDLYECTITKFIQHVTLTDLIIHFLNFLNLFEQYLNIFEIQIHTDIDHILGLLQKCYHPTPSHDDVMFENHAAQEEMCAQELEKLAVRFKNHTAEELERAGVNFKPIQNNADWPLAIKIESSRFPSISWCFGMPTLKMPLLCINDFTELVLRNLIAYEQCSDHEVPPYVTSYAAFMDMLVNTQDDVAKLVEWGVIDNSLGSNEEAANMINKICKEVALGNSPYSPQLAELDKYYNGNWPKHIARLRGKYFNSPWNFIALVAAIILFALTVIQTVKAM